MTRSSEWTSQPPDTPGSGSIHSAFILRSFIAEKACEKSSLALSGDALRDKPHRPGNSLNLHTSASRALAASLASQSASLRSETSVLNVLMGEKQLRVRLLSRCALTPLQVRGRGWGVRGAKVWVRRGVRCP